MISVIFSRIVILLFGVLYPAYSSYKAVRTRDVKKYVQWMMYWIVFAFFTCIETFTDIFISWFPFYYEIKVILVIWLLSPATKGSSVLYRKFVHPMLTRRESDIDEYLSQAKEKSYSTMVELGSKGVNYATSVIMQTAIKSVTNLGQAKELMGRFSGDQNDGICPSRYGDEARVSMACRVDGELEGGDVRCNEGGKRNKRSLSVDSGLQHRREKVVNCPELICEENEDDDDCGPVVTMRVRKPRCGAEGDEIDQMIARKGKREACKSTSGNRLRGRANIH